MALSIPQLDALRDEWPSLASDRRTPLLDHDWFLSCAEAFHAASDLRIVTARLGGQLVGVAPLVQEQSATGRRVMQLGVSRLYEPSDWLCASDDAASDLVDQALALGPPVVLQRLPEVSIVARALRARPWRNAVTLARSTASALAVPTQGRWTDYYGRLSSQVTSNLKRVRRKAEAALGPMRVEHLTPAPSEVDALLESFIVIEGSGWKGRRGSNLGTRADLRGFFWRYCHRAAAQERLHIARLSFGSHTAAAELSVVAYARMWQLKIGYHDSVGAYYPGLHLTSSSIQWAFEQGLEAYEFLGSAAPWEERWRPEVRLYQTVAAYPMTTSGMVGAGRDLVSAAWRRVPGQRGAS